MRCQSVGAQLFGCDAQTSISNVSVQKRLFTSDAGISDLNLSSAPASSCPAGAPQTQIPSQGRKRRDLNPVTLHRNDSTGSLTAAKRGYDTESVVVVAAASSSPPPPPPPNLSVGEWGSDYLTLGERKGPQQLLRAGYGGGAPADVEVLA